MDIKLKYENIVYVKQHMKDLGIMKTFEIYFLLFLYLLLSCMAGLGSICFCVYYHMPILYCVLYGLLASIVNILVCVTALRYCLMEEKRIYSDYRDS